jgi:hypothetical protein
MLTICQDSRFPSSKTSTFGIPASFTNNVVPIHASVLKPPEQRRVVLTIVMLIFLS